MREPRTFQLRGLGSRVGSEEQPFLEQPPSRHWWLWGITVVLALVAAGVASAILPKKFTVTEISVVDARPEVAAAVQAYAQEVVRDRAQLFGHTNIFLVPRAFLERELPKRLPVIHTVQVLRRLPGTLHIAVQEKVPVALLFAGGRYYALDPEGIAFEEVPAERLRDNTFPILRDERPQVRIEIGQHVIDPVVLTMVHDLISLLPERFHLAVKEVTIPAIGTEELHVRVNEGWVFLLDAKRPLLIQLAALEKIFAEEIDPEERLALEYLDLRIPGKAFYTLREVRNKKKEIRNK